MTGTHKSNYGHICLTGADGRVDDPQVVADMLNNFFVKTPLDLVGDITKGTSTEYGTDPLPHSIFLMPFTESELYNLLFSKLKNSKSSEPDSIPVFIIRLVLDAIIPPLLYLINLSFSTGTFPEALKVGKVIPVFKGKGSAGSLENYRPINVSNSFSKIFEYPFLDRLLCFLDKHHVITEHQHGFRAGHSTTSAVGAFYRRTVELIDAGECPVGIFCDLSRAFDCVSHSKLFTVLFDVGIRGVALEWVSAFLLDRRQYVAVHGGKRGKCTSTLSTVSMGVAQGSVLGPLLFILYVNNIDSALGTTFFTMYADDLAMLVSHASDAGLKKECGRVLSGASDFFAEYSLYFNVSKTKIIRFHNWQRNCGFIDVSIGGVSLPVCDDVKFLGTCLDESLTWRPHCENLSSKLSSIRYLFVNLKPVLTRAQLLNLYYSQVESRLRQGIRFWGNSAWSQKVFIAQKQILRTMAGVPNRHSCGQIFPDFNLLTVHGLYIFETCVYVYSNRHVFAKVSDIHPVNTRQRDKLYVPFTKFSVVSRSSEYAGLKIFNSLPAHLRELTGCRVFKRELKQYLVARCLYKVSEFSG